MAAMRARREQVGRDMALHLRVSDNGEVHAGVPGGRYSHPPHLNGHFEAEGGSVILTGVIRESLGQVFLPRFYMTLSVIMLLVAIGLAVGKVVPGLIICFVAAVLFGLLGYGLGRLRGSSFRIDSKNLMEKVNSLLPEQRPHRLP